MKSLPGFEPLFYATCEDTDGDLWCLTFNESFGKITLEATNIRRMSDIHLYSYSEEGFKKLRRVVESAGKGFWTNSLVDYEYEEDKLTLNKKTLRFCKVSAKIEVLK